jgi:Domain of unknown function (DUF1707)
MAVRGHLRASHADREQVIAALKVAFVQGRLTKDELDARAGQTFASRTYGELAALTADLPTGLITAMPPRKLAPARARPPVSKVVAGAALVIPPPAMVAAAFLTDSEQVAKLAMMVVLVFFMAWMVAGAVLLDSWHQRRSRGQLPPRPWQDGLTVEGEQDAGIGDGLMHCEVRRAVRAHHGHGTIQAGGGHSRCALASTGP